jgi:hypothetical protein
MVIGDKANGRAKSEIRWIQFHGERIRGIVLELPVDESAGRADTNQIRNSVGSRIPIVKTDKSLEIGKQCISGDRRHHCFYIGIQWQRQGLAVAALPRAQNQDRGDE